MTVTPFPRAALAAHVPTPQRRAAPAQDRRPPKAARLGKRPGHTHAHRGLCEATHGHGQPQQHVVAVGRQPQQLGDAREGLGWCGPVDGGGLGPARSLKLEGPALPPTAIRHTDPPYLGKSCSSSARWGTWGTVGPAEPAACSSVMNTRAACARKWSIFSLACWARQHMTRWQLQTKSSAVAQLQPEGTRDTAAGQHGLCPLPTRQGPTTAALPRSPNARSRVEAVRTEGSRWAAGGNGAQGRRRKRQGQEGAPGGKGQKEEGKHGARAGGAQETGLAQMQQPRRGAWRRRK